MNTFGYRRVVGIIALLAWIASLALPVETDCGFSYANPGYLILLAGWLGPLGGQFGWYANPFMVWTMGRLLFKKRPGVIPAILGLGLALSALAWKTTPTDTGYNTMCARHSGFYAWIACAVVLAFVAVAEFTVHPKSKSEGGAS